MVDYKAVLIIVVLLFTVGGLLTWIVSPHFENAEPNNESALYGLADSVENGHTVDLPILGNMTFNPVSWFWLGIDPVTEEIGDSLTSLTYIPDVIAVPFIILIIFSFSYLIITIIKDLIPFT